VARILIIDDDDAMRRLITRALAKRHEVLEAKNGDEGLKLLAQHSPDLMVTDILMPQKEGIETIREAQERLPDMKIVAISGGGTSHNMMFLDVARAFGADAVIAKPFHVPKLVETVEAVLAKVKNAN
jgi:DNA-binding response OmpR family regulator